MLCNMTDEDVTYLLSKIRVINLFKVPLAAVGLMTNALLITVIFKTRYSERYASYAF